MSRKYLLLSVLFALTGCTINPNVSGETTSESESKNEEEIVSSLYLNSKYVTETIDDGSISFSDANNIIVINKDNTILYTVGNINLGYGSNNKCYFATGYSKYIKENEVEIPKKATGYVVSDEGYGIFVNELTCGKISTSNLYTSSDNLDSWNNQSNKYITTLTTISILDNKKLETSKIEPLNNDLIRLSSIKDEGDEENSLTYKMIAPYTDTYTITGDDCNLSLYSLNGNLLKKEENKITISLNKNDMLYFQVYYPSYSSFNVEIKAKDHEVVLPYEINSNVDVSDYSTTNTDSLTSLKACNLNYTKRSDDRGLYINCNNPEKLSLTDLNKCLCCQDVTEKDVFFTFEHNNISTTGFYYGYRVTNTGDSDLFITVKNLGFHCKGTGMWLGEDEWVKFYNYSFKSDLSGLSESALKNYQAYVGFSNSYESENRQPITYRIPSGSYIYVIGGTTVDSYLKTNVFNSANQKIQGGCGNGAVIFETHGSKAYGEFVVYNNIKTLASNISKDKEQGYVTLRNGTQYGQQYVGYDDCHGVVDADLVWQFNDATFNTSRGNAINLPVAYTNPYYTRKGSGEAYSETTNRIEQKYTWANFWDTHINPQYTATAVGTDMTYYKVSDALTNKDICIDPWHLDGRGDYCNIGNWMVDYIDTITLVNQSSKDRTFTYTLTFNGVILAFVRNMDGSISDTITPRYYTYIASSSYGDAIHDPFTYTVVVKANSILQFAVNYNLLANSNGKIKHQATIK